VAARGNFLKNAALHLLPKAYSFLKRKLSLALHTILVLPILLILYRLKINAFLFKSGSGIEVRFRVLKVNTLS